MLFEQKSLRKSNVEIITCPFIYTTQLISSIDFLHDFLRQQLKIITIRTVFSGFAFFLAPKIGALFLFLKGVARQGRALISDTYR